MITFQTKISRTKLFSPSKLSLIDQCRLSYLLQTENIGHKLPAGAHSFYGTAIHKTIEHLLPVGETSNPEIKKILMESLSNALLKSSESSPILDWAIKKNGVSKIYDNARLIGAIHQIKKTILQYSKTKHLETNLVGQKYGGRKNQLGSETTFEVQKYDIAGNIDYSFLDSSGVIHIVDFKSGGVLDEDGALKDEYYYQIGFYGLMVEEHYPECKIILEVSGANDFWVGDLDSDFKNSLIKKIKKYSVDIPLGVEFSLESLAQLGSHCSGCRSRSACPQYFELLKVETVDLESEILSRQDLYGKVDEIVFANDFFGLKLKSAANVTISISGLPKNIFGEIAIGSNIACYNFKFYDHESLCNFPANYYVYRSDIPKISAFEAVVLI